MGLDVIAFGDFDSDGDVDQQDFARFQRCLTDFGMSYASGCLAGDRATGPWTIKMSKLFHQLYEWRGKPPGC